MTNKKKILVSLGVALLILVIFGIYNNPDRKNKITLPPEEQQVADSLMARAPQLQEINGRAKISTANLISLIHSAETNGFDIKTFNFYSDNLFTISSELQAKLDDIRSLLNSNRSLFEKSQIKDAWLTMIDVFEFRSEYNQKLIQLTKIGAHLKLGDQEGLNRLTEVWSELEAIESRLPEMENKYIQAISKFDIFAGKQLESQLEGQKNETTQLINKANTPIPNVQGLFRRL